MRKMSIIFTGCIIASSLSTFGMKKSVIFDYCLERHPDLVYDYIQRSSQSQQSRQKHKRNNRLLFQLAEKNHYLPALLLLGEKLLKSPQQQSKEKGVTFLLEAAHLDCKRTCSHLSEESLLLIGEKLLTTQNEEDRLRGIAFLLEAARLGCRRACSLLSNECFKQSKWHEGVLWLLPALKPIRTPNSDSRKLMGYDGEALVILGKVRQGRYGSLAKEAIEAIEKAGSTLP
jgi:hypothetical protein